MAPGATAARSLKALWRLVRDRPWWLLALLVAAATTFNPGLQRLDLLAFDLLAPRMAEPSARSVLVAIDEASIAALGQWPWSREVHARMVNRLAAAGATGVAFAVLLSEPQAHGSEADAGDEAFAAALSAYGRAVLPVVPVPRAAVEEASESVGGTDSLAASGVTELKPLPILRKAAHLGHVDLEVDADGVVRRLFLRGGARAELPALSAALVEQAQPLLTRRPLPGLRSHLPAIGKPGVWERDNEVLLPHAPPPNKAWSFADALESPAFAEAVRGRTILIGVTARGLGPELAIAGLGKHTTLPVVYFHSLAYDAFVAGALLTPWPPAASALVTLALLLVAMALWPAGEQRWIQALLATSVLLPLAFSWLLLRTVQIWWGPAPAALGLLVAWGAWLAVRMNASARAAQLARRDAKAMLDSIGDAVISLDADSHISYLNGPAQALATRAGPIGGNVEDAFSFDTESAIRLSATVRRALETREVARVSEHLLLKPAGGRARALSATISPLLTESGAPEGVVIGLSDLTEAVAAAQQLSHAATHDALTGLPNRSLVHDRLGHATARALRRSSTVAVLFLDLDRFKRINDSLGHLLGDEVLRITGQRLLATCRANDTVGRWGGDEFVVLLEDLAGREAVATVAKKIVEALSQPMLLDGVEVPSACSVGIAIAPDDGIDADELLAMADAAMYRAKSLSGCHYQFYMSDLNHWTRDRLTLELDMRNGLARGEFELHYQPQLHLASNTLVGFEALLRWRRANGELLMPVQFIGLAEESGMIIELGEWVMREAARQIADWTARGLKAVPVAINVSARQCLDRQLVDSLRAVIEASGIDAALLKIEITESTAMANAENAVSLFDEIRALGIRLSVDDFGTGYSSLSRLKRFPIGEIKIDQSFVRDMTTDPDDAAIVRATIALAHGLGLRVVAEGVETHEQKMFLTYHDCDVVQGYLYGRPQPAKQVQSLLATVATGGPARAA